MKRNVLCCATAVLGAALLGFGVQRAAAADDCRYQGTRYSHGAASCQTGVQFRCDDGEWKAMGVACNENGGPSANCMFGGVTYPNGSASCQGGSQYRCESGTWASLGVGCPAADSPIRPLPQGRNCQFNDALVAHNATMCVDGRSYLCSDGDWVILGTKCHK